MDAQDRNSVILPGFCGCGCGASTALNKVAALSKGNSQTAIAEELGVSRYYVRGVLKNPPRYVKGHWKAPVADRMLSRAATLERKAQADRELDQRIKERRHWSNYARMDRSKVRARAHGNLVRAFNLRLLTPFVSDPLVASVQSFADRVRASTAGHRREPDPVIEWLRNQVEVGWRHDRPVFNPKLVSIEGLDLRAERRSGDAGWWEDKRALDPQEILEQRLEEQVAEIMANSTDPLVIRALAVPEALSNSDREYLQEIYAHIERDLWTGGPDAVLLSKWFTPQYGGGVNHGRGGGGRKKHQKAAQHKAQRQATGRIHRPARKPRQKYRPVEMAS